MSRDNNINFLRILFALTVLVAHSFPMCFSSPIIVGKGYGVGGAR